MKKEDLFVVGIGASAGGFEALQRFLPKLSENDRVTYIIAQHLDPNRTTLLGELLSKSSAFSVIPVVDGQEIKANHIYFCPPGKDVILENGRLKLSKPENQSLPKPSINKFFSSLAKEKKEKAIGIILSGTGSDGAKGIVDIYNNGGITLTEDEGAKYFSMPKASIDTKKVTASLPPELLAEGIENILEDREYFEKQFALQDSLEKIYDILNKKTNIDFTSYKEATISRRIKKRMNETKSNGVDDYLKVLEEDENEVEKLKNELLIIVTSFFRDIEAFEELEKNLEKLIQNKLDNILRIWVCACATGEEAYTIAIIISDILKKHNLNKKVLIFATDISEKVITESRNKFFNKEQLEGVPSHYIDEYFDYSNFVYRPKKNIRDMIVFSKHDVIKDPPFSNIDLVSCRNLLIYFDNELQKRILSIFYYAMRYESLLFLGKSESIGSLSSLYSVLDAKYRIYKKSNNIAQIDLEVLTYIKKHNSSINLNRKELEDKKLIDIDYSINKSVSRVFGKSGVVIDGTNSTILFFKGDCRDFINHPKGVHTSDIFRLVADYLKLDLRAILNDAVKNNKFVSSKKIRVMPISEPKEYVTINVFPLDKNNLGEKTFFVTFDKEVDFSRSLNDEIFEPINLNESEVNILEEELLTLKERLQITIEELETSNEELQSTNEELQSTNEELETSNEELQSTNEELQTVNDELSYANLELEFSNKAFNNVLSNLDAYVMILDKDLNIIKFTDGINKFFEMTRIIDSNFSSLLLNSNIELPNLLTDIKECLNLDKAIGYDIVHNNRNYYFRIKSIDLTLSNDLLNKGIVLSFVDKTDIVKQENLLFQQSKMASMGEMISNIAHQWRQPLNNLNLLISSHSIDYKYGELTNESMIEFKESANKIIQKMSSTIDDFRNFFSPRKIKESFTLDEVLEESIGFIKNSFINNNISVEKEVLYTKEINGYKNELIQVFLNILNNSKDAIKLKKKEKGLVQINVFDNENYVKILFKDNAGGVSQEVLDRMFEPYFTTKFQDQGTGLGLYMSKMIIEESIKGTILAENTEKGLQIMITLPKDVK